MVAFAKHAIPDCRECLVIPPQRGSDCVEFQVGEASLQGDCFLSIALRMRSSFRIQATIAVIFAFPRWRMALAVLAGIARLETRLEYAGPADSDGIGNLQTARWLLFVYKEGPSLICRGPLAHRAPVALSRCKSLTVSGSLRDRIIRCLT